MNYIIRMLIVRTLNGTFFLVNFQLFFIVFILFLFLDAHTSNKVSRLYHFEMLIYFHFDRKERRVKENSHSHTNGSNRSSSNDTLHKENISLRFYHGFPNTLINPFFIYIFIFIYSWFVDYFILTLWASKSTFLTKIIIHLCFPKHDLPFTTIVVFTHCWIIEPRELANVHRYTHFSYKFTIATDMNILFITNTITTTTTKTTEEVKPTKTQDTQIRNRSTRSSD